MPDWVVATCGDYSKRLPREYALQIIEVPAERRTKNQSTEVAKLKETQRLLAAVPAGDQIVALDERGDQLSTASMAKKLASWSDSGQNISILLGGADGIAYDCSVKGRIVWPDWKWSLSKMTFPHPLARVIVTEQLYRAWSVHVGHPYHRE